MGIGPMKEDELGPVKVEITDQTFDADHPNSEHVIGVIYDPISAAHPCRPEAA